MVYVVDIVGKIVLIDNVIIKSRIAGKLLIMDRRNGLGLAPCTFLEERSTEERMESELVSRVSFGETEGRAESTASE